MFGPGPAHPFTGFVLNLSVATCAHWDTGDLDFCLLFTFGDWEGGELCIWETGMVFTLLWFQRTDNINRAYNACMSLMLFWSNQPE